MSMLSYVPENMYMVGVHVVYFHYCNDAEKISMWSFFESLKNIWYIHLLQYDSLNGSRSQYFVSEVLTSQEAL